MSYIKISCHTIVLGSGNVALEAFKEAYRINKDTILIHKATLDDISVCANDVPISLLLKAAKDVHKVKTLSFYGVEANDAYFDTRDVLSVIREKRAKFAQNNLKYIYSLPHENHLAGDASFLDSNHLIVDDKYKIEFITAIIATDSIAVIPYEMGKLGGILNPRDIFNLELLPQSVAIFGSTLWGLQLGEALSYLGVKVTVFGDDKLWHLTDDIVQKVAATCFKERFNFITNADMTEISRSKNGYNIYYFDESGCENFLTTDYVVSCAIHAPCIAGLNLKEIGVKLDRAGFISVDQKTMQTSIPNIFAVGEVSSYNVSLAMANRLGSLAGRNASFFPNVEMNQVFENLELTFTDPALGVVGMSLENVKNSSYANVGFVISEVDFKNTLFRNKEESDGLMRMYVDIKSHKLLGAEICSKDALHIGQFLSFAIKMNAKIEDLAYFNFHKVIDEEAIARGAQKALSIIKRNQNKAEFNYE